jgi:ABC-type lipoprotein export system ATPase subunit
MPGTSPKAPAAATPPEGPVLAVTAGTDKHGRPEPFAHLEFRAGTTVAIVGPTGSGKTRLLADVERLSPGDSPTRRRVALTGVSDALLSADRAVARISQSMQFFLDLTVMEFLQMHRESVGRAPDEVDLLHVLDQANRLAGEPFAGDAPLAALSGGQARALMIADVLHVSDAPVLLVDEIENAGIDRHAALDVLGRPDRLVFLATHDPLIALRADRRLVLGEGAIRAVHDTSAAERAVADRLSLADREAGRLREALRRGERLD